MKWNVIFFWQGQRHHGGQFASKTSALEALRVFKADGWVCHIEQVVR